MSSSSLVVLDIECHNSGSRVLSARCSGRGQCAFIIGLRLSKLKAFIYTVAATFDLNPPGADSDPLMVRRFDESNSAFNSPNGHAEPQKRSRIRDPIRFGKGRLRIGASG